VSSHRGYCLGKEKATRRWLCGEVEAGYLMAYTAQVQMPAQTAVEMIQVQPLTVMRFMSGTMRAFGDLRIDGDQELLSVTQPRT
jgi:hypothetical protein